MPRIHHKQALRSTLKICHCVPYPLPIHHAPHDASEAVAHCGVPPGRLVQSHTLVGDTVVRSMACTNITQCHVHARCLDKTTKRPSVCIMRLDFSCAFPWRFAVPEANPRCCTCLVAREVCESCPTPLERAARHASRAKRPSVAMAAGPQQSLSLSRVHAYTFSPLAREDTYVSACVGAEPSIGGLPEIDAWKTCPARFHGPPSRSLDVGAQNRPTISVADHRST